MIGENETEMVDPLRFAELRTANRSRVVRWHPPGSEPWGGADWSNAMCGEAGEAANVVKKIRRIETKVNITREGEEGLDLLVYKLGLELADMVTYADLLAEYYGIDLAEAVRDKFNIVSTREGFPERL